MDEAFMPFAEIVRRLLAFGDELLDEEQGVRSYIYEYIIESPVELDVVKTDDGQVQIGSTPPLYYVDTSIRPSFHRLKFKADLAEVSRAD
ncbi:MAG TPA: hypothetical protein VGJ48_20075 [Pyrinomonadaceae bacterium]|jgi:hypothetical protein